MRQKRGGTKRIVAIAGAGSAVLLTTALMWGRVAKPPPPLPAPPLPPPPAASKYPDPPGIVIHDSDSPGKVGGVAMDAARLDAIHRRQGYGVEFEGKKYHIAYHYVILPDGTIERGRPDYCPGAHAPLFNRWLGICLIGAFSTNRKNWSPNKPTKAQTAALYKLCKELMSKYHIPPSLVQRHRDVTWTWCPGDNFPWAKVKQELTEYARLHPETNPTDGRPLTFKRPTREEQIAYKKKVKEEERKAAQEAVRRKAEEAKRTEAGAAGNVPGAGTL